MWLDKKEQALHRCPVPRELPPIRFSVLSPFEMLPVEVGGDKAFHVHFPPAHVQPLKWLSCASSVSKVTAKDVLSVRGSGGTVR